MYRDLLLHMIDSISNFKFIIFLVHTFDFLTPIYVID